MQFIFSGEDAVFDEINPDKAKEGSLRLLLLYRIVEYQKSFKLRTDDFISRLSQAVSFKSISGNPEAMDDINGMIHFTQKELEKLGTECQQIKNGKQKLPSGEEIDLPPLLFGTLGNDEAKTTVMKISGSKGLGDVLLNQKDSFLHNIDFTCIAAYYWLGKTKPCIIYGQRGICCYSLELNVFKTDYDGITHDGISDIRWILSQLTEDDGTIKIDGLKEMIAPVTDEEQELYDKIDFDINDY
uniref:DNA-directed RNA polymerase n=1 Tax=Panagrolaimus sp. ES5 TaxID=591445 RepID=A0AC34FBL4_9BILA